MSEQSKISPHDAVILWNCDSQLRIADVVVVDHEDQRVQDHRRYPYCTGRVVLGWMTHETLTPAGVLDDLDAAGWSSPQHRAAALEQFAQIDGAATARDNTDEYERLREMLRGSRNTLH